MFFRVSAFVLAIVASVIAAPGGGTTTGSCNTGQLSCCNTDGSVFSDCTPFSIVGTGSAGSCTSDPVCCTNDYSNGLIVVNCTPVNIGA